MFTKKGERFRQTYTGASYKASEARKATALSLVVFMLGSAVGLLASFNLHASYAAFPGSNGKIVFESQRNGGVPTVGNIEIYIMNADGTAQTRLTTDPSIDTAPVLSPDGRKILFTSNRVIGETGIYSTYVMNADGTNQTLLSTDAISPSWSPEGTKIVYSTLHSVITMNADGTGKTPIFTTNSGLVGSPVWSPDGTKIAFASNMAGNWEIYIIAANGSGTPTNLTNNSADDNDPDWSPDGSKIAFTSLRDPNAEIYVMNADGTNQARLSKSSSTTSSVADIDGDPSWSPDGTKIAFAAYNNGISNIYVMNADGTGKTDISNGTAHDSSPNWGRAPQQQVSLTVRSQDTKGSPISGYWTVLYDSNGNVLKTGFTPVSFNLQAGQTYKVRMGNYGSYSFDHWLDNNSSANPRSITINSNTQLTAVYKTSTTYPITHMSDTTASAGYGVHAPKSGRAETVSTTSQLIGDKIDSITLKLKRVGTISGTATVGILDASNNVKKSFGTIDVSKLTTTYTDYEFHLSNNELYTIQSGDRIGIKYTGGDANNWVSVMLDLNSADPFDGQNSYQSYFNPSSSPPTWNGDSGRDMYMILKQTHA